MISSSSCTTLDRPIRCTKADKVDEGGLWRFAHTSGEKLDGCVAPKRASLGGKCASVEAGVDAIWTAFEAKLFTAWAIEQVVVQKTLR